MDNGLVGPIYQYYTIQNNTQNLIDLNQLSNTTQVNDGQVLLLAFNEESDNKDDPNNLMIDSDDVATQTENDSISSAIGANVNLVTLDDGTILMTDDGESLQIESSLDQKDETELGDTTLFLSNDADGGSYQLIQLEDGTQSLLQLYNIETVNSDVEVKKPEHKYHCNYEGCDKSYATSYHLTVHKRVHTNGKPYACTIEGCDKRFTTNYSLKTHIRTHTGEKPYGCMFCHKHFKTSGDLLKHIRIHTGEKPFSCPIDGCFKSFTTSNIRKVHIRSHTGERPFQCDFPNCGKAFTSSTNYKNHVRIHSGIKPYVCSVEGCGKRFTEYSSLYKHNMVHEPGKLYYCLVCGHKFKQESALNVHKRTKHNMVVTRSGTEIMVDFQ